MFEEMVSEYAGQIIANNPQMDHDSIIDRACKLVKEVVDRKNDNPDPKVSHLTVIYAGKILSENTGINNNTIVDRAYELACAVIKRNKDHALHVVNMQIKYKKELRSDRQYDELIRDEDKKSSLYSNLYNTAENNTDKFIEAKNIYNDAGLKRLQFEDSFRKEFAKNNNVHEYELKTNYDIRTNY